MSQYDLLLDGKYYLRDVIIGSITLEDSLDDIAGRLTFDIARVNGLKIDVGMDIKLLGVPYGTNTQKTMFAGVVYEIRSSREGAGTVSVTCYDRAKYLAISEEQWQFKPGKASDRLKKYAAAFSIPVGSIPDTGITLAKALYRPQSIYSSIRKDLLETAQKGGKMYKPRMNESSKLDLYEVGSNKTVFKLEDTAEDITQTRTMEGMVTKVKVVGQIPKKKTAKKKDDPKTPTKPKTLAATAATGTSKGATNKEDVLYPVVATKTGNTAKYGTLQRIYQKDDADSVATAAKIAESMLTDTFKETIGYSGAGVNVVRAGDKIQLADYPTELIVRSVTLKLSDFDMMTLELATAKQIREDLYSGDN